ncbi:hypothetical protein SHO565_64680 [Streptomyces sp. HO565]
MTTDPIAAAASLAAGEDWPPTALGVTGRPAAEVLAELDGVRAADAPTRGGRMFATVNGLNPTVFPSVARLENDVVGAVTAVLGARPARRGRSPAAAPSRSCWR